MPRNVVLLAVMVLIGLLPRMASGTTFIVDQNDPAANDSNNGMPDAPFKTIARAAKATRPGHTVLVRAGIYRESVILENSGTRAKPIEFVADRFGSVIVTGSEPLVGLAPVPDAPGVFRAPWNHIFAIDHDENGKAVEFHPDEEPLWGRAEQVTVDDKLLLPVKDLAALRKIDGDPTQPIAHLGGPFAGWFCVDTGTQSLYLRLADRSDPASQKIEAATRDLLFGTTPFMNEKGVSNVHVRGFTFRDGATFPQRGGVSLHGSDNLLEDCVIERMAGTGVSVSGTMRRCIVRNNGHTGGGASGDGFVNEDCTWEGNSWKPISRGWEAGGMKIADCANGLYRRCIFRRNGGPGLWLDVNVRNVIITECVFAENETSGLFIEISRNITVTNNLAVRNGVDVIGKLDDDAWSVAGIQLAESMNCLIANNTCARNRDGITLREQGPRTIPTADGDVDFHNIGHTIVSNILADNEGFQIGFWYDSEKYDIAKQRFLIDRNLYHRKGDGPIVLYGAPWRDQSQEFSTLEAFAKFTRFETLGRVADPLFVDPDKDFRTKPDSPAREMNAGCEDEIFPVPSSVGRGKND